MRRAGVLDKIREDGLELYDFCWRKLGGEYIAGIKGVFDKTYQDRYITLPVDQVTQVIYEELQKYDNAHVYWKHDFKGVTQDDKEVTVSVEHRGQVKTYTADFLLGCDGGRSDVRRALFGRSFPGYTWDVQIVATNVSPSLLVLEDRTDSPAASISRWENGKTRMERHLLDDRPRALGRGGQDRNQSGRLASVVRRASASHRGRATGTLR